MPIQSYKSNADRGAILILRTTSVALIILISIGCESSNLTGASDGDASKDSGDAAGDDSADEPVMVGGAHLACVNLSAQQQLVDSTEIGCAVMDPSKGKKADLTKYQNEWVIVDNSGTPIQVQEDEGSFNDPYHRLFTYQDNSYMQHKLKVSITASNGQKQVYERQLAVLDASFVNVIGSASEEVEVAFLEDNQTPMPLGCLSDPNCNSWSASRELFETLLKPCYFGDFNSLYDEARSGDKNAKVMLGKDCIINTAELKPTEVNGCYKVPMIKANRQFVVAIIEGDTMSVQELQAHVAKHACQAGTN